MSTFRVLSPDMIDIAPQTYRTLYSAQKALAKWVQNYSAQGFYSQTCHNGYVRRIPLNELPDHCEIINVDDR